MQLRARHSKNSYATQVRFTVSEFVLHCEYCGVFLIISNPILILPRFHARLFFWGLGLDTLAGKGSISRVLDFEYNVS